MMENSNTVELAALGCTVIYSNPDTYNFKEYDLVIYTIALPAPIQKAKISIQNKQRFYGY